MNTDRDFDRLLDEWFADGPREAADRVVIGVADRIERQSQRPAWRLLRRSPMRSAMTYGLAAAAVLVAAVAGFSLLQKGSSVGGPLATATPAPAGTSSGPSPSRATGVVDASAFGVPLTLTLSGGWTLAVIEPTNLELLHGDTDLAFHPLERVTLPGATLTDPWIPVPADFDAWVRQRPEFTAFQTRPVTVGGRSGTEIDAAIAWKTGETRRSFLEYGTGGWAYQQGDDGNRIRFIVVPGPSGDGFIIVMNAPAADFDAAAGALDVVLSTVQFTAPGFIDGTRLLVPITLTLSGGWTYGGVDSNNLELFWNGQNVDLGIHPISTVTLPGPKTTDPWIPVPADFVSWVKQRPEWKDYQTRPVTVGGRAGTEIDAAFVWDAGMVKRDFLRYTTGAWLYDQYNVGHRIRFVVVPGTSGDGLIIVVNAPAADFDAAAAALDTVLATVQFVAPTASPSS